MGRRVLDPLITNLISNQTDQTAINHPSHRCLQETITWEGVCCIICYLFVTWFCSDWLCDNTSLNSLSMKVSAEWCAIQWFYGKVQRTNSLHWLPNHSHQLQWTQKEHHHALWNFFPLHINSWSNFLKFGKVIFHCYHCNFHHYELSSKNIKF